MISVDNSFLTSVTRYLFYSNEYLRNSYYQLNNFHKTSNFNFSVISIIAIFGKILSYFVDFIILISIIRENR